MAFTEILISPFAPCNISLLADTFVGFLRLLLFLYTNTLPDGSDGALLEDLMAADR